jgi:hypothetical protein
MTQELHRATPVRASLEDFVQDAFSYDSEERYAAELEKYEPLRGLIEYWISDFYEPATGSWRDFRNSLLERAQELLQRGDW